MQSLKVFLDTVRIYGRPSTITSYGFWLVKFNEFVKQKDDKDVTITDLAEWVAVLRLRYAPKTVALAIASVKEYLSEYSPQINTRRVKIPKAYALHPSDPITPEEYVSMISFIRADTKIGVRDNLLIRLLYDSGARIGEVHALLTHPEKIQKGMAVIDTEKTSEKRYICWGKDTQVFLDTWLSFNECWPTIRHCARIVRGYAKLAKIEKKITCHSFRHTFAHRILDNGGTVKDIQSVMGHKSPVSSFHYLNEYDQEKVVRARKWVDG